MKKLYSVLILVACGLTCIAQLDQYNYSHEIKGVSDQWHSIAIPFEAYSVAQQNLNDLRIYGISDAQDTIEVPYLIRTGAGKRTRVVISGNLIDKSFTPEGYYYTIQMPQESLINQIALLLDSDNFDWKLKLEGSYDQIAWFVIKDDNRIVALKNAQSDYRYTNLNFEQSKYPYYRIFIPSEKDPGLTSVKSYLQKDVEGEYNEYSPSQVNQKVNSANQNLIEISLSQKLPVSKITINAEDTISYYRPLTIQYLSDSILTGKEYKYNYRTAYQGTLSSFEKASFVFDEIQTSKLKVLIANHDNQALKIESLKIIGYTRELVARFLEPASYKLYYGNKSTRKPKYDLVAFESSIPSKCPKLDVGPQRPTGIKIKDGEALFVNSWWLWGLMLLVILILGFFSFVMMKNMKE